MGLNTNHKNAQKPADPMATLKEEWRRGDRPYAVVITTATRPIKVVPHEEIHNYKMYDGDDDEAFYSVLPCHNASKT